MKVALLVQPKDDQKVFFLFKTLLGKYDCPINEKSDIFLLKDVGLYLFDTIDMAWVGIRVSRFVSIYLPDGKINYCVAPSSRRQRRSSAPHLDVQISHSKEKSRKSKCSFCFFGPSVEIRTRGLLNPIQARYQTSPHPDISLSDSFDRIPHRIKKCKYFFEKTRK